MNLPRTSGVQLHPTSLPSGRLGREAYGFVDWLAAAGQSWWQMLPLGPPDKYGSPYKAASAFANSAGLLADRRGPGPKGPGEEIPQGHPDSGARGGGLSGGPAVGPHGPVGARGWAAPRPA